MTSMTSRLEPWSQTVRQASPLEDQFFNILRDAIIRAERRPVSNLNVNRRSTLGSTRLGASMDQSTNTNNPNANNESEQ